jgi:hypothetical protein
MMDARFKQKLPEEIELELKRAELVSLSALRAAALAELQQVRDEISQFEQLYDQTLGRRIAELERIEAEISLLTGYASENGKQCQNESASASATSRDEDGSPSGDSGGSRRGDDEFRSCGPDAPKGRAERSDEQDIKALYREVAKAIHPDLACAGLGESERHELMTRANRAYAQRDRRALQEILRSWKRSPGTVYGNDIAAELIRVIRQIAQERQEIKAAKETVEELRGSYVCRFKLKIEASLAQGTDLFAEMIAAADLNIARALSRLALLKGERSGDAGRGTAGQRRAICFPADNFSGTLYLRDRSSLSFNRWKKVGPAKGCLEIDPEKAVRLDVKADSAVKLTQMRQFKPDDLQALFLYEVGDTDLDSIAHLTGLEELYLSGPRLTDAALSGISTLTNLKQIYLYQTVITDRGLMHLQRLPKLKGLTSSGNSITDEGLAVFKRTIPGMKTVSFPWRYSR